MKPHLKFSLILGFSFILAGCQLNKKPAEAFPAAENQLVVLEEVPAELITEDEFSPSQAAVVAYHVPSQTKRLTLYEEAYLSGQLLSRQVALELTEVDPKGHILLQIAELETEEQTEGQEYQLSLKAIGTQAHQGNVQWQVNLAEQSQPLVDFAVTSAKELESAMTEQTLFAVKLSHDTELSPLTADFLNEPNKHLEEVGEGEVVYLFRCHFTPK